MDPLAPIGDGHTELSDEDREGLIPAYIATRGDLFDAEQRNIANAHRVRTSVMPVPAHGTEASYVSPMWPRSSNRR